MDAMNERWYVGLVERAMLTEAIVALLLSPHRTLRTLVDIMCEGESTTDVPNFPSSSLVDLHAERPEQSNQVVNTYPYLEIRPQIAAKTREGTQAVITQFVSERPGASRTAELLKNLFGEDAPQAKNPDPNFKGVSSGALLQTFKDSTVRAISSGG